MEMGFEVVDFIHLTHNRVEWLAFSCESERDYCMGSKEFLDCLNWFQIKQEAAARFSLSVCVITFIVCAFARSCIL
jgi:hypothetical protein